MSARILEEMVQKIKEEVERNLNQLCSYCGDDDICLHDCAIFWFYEKIRKELEKRGFKFTTMKKNVGVEMVETEVPIVIVGDKAYIIDEDFRVKQLNPS